ncbi:MAG TPA: beta-L-arabinofuranosidase domain-containing protein [Lachnospiraceae bacterium]|nr:beta-L-arabinofuranosidase domain-containing protein [Lachnospiraceae bacterium]
MANSIKVPEFSKFSVTDNLFQHYVNLVATKLIPYQWNVLNGKGEYVNSHCIDNFMITAGLKKGKHMGVVFGDTDAYKWLETVAFCAMYGKKEYLAEADELIDIIEKAQQPDGYLNTYYTIVEPELRWTNLREGHELYSAGHMIEAATAYYAATGNEQILNVAIRFADLIFDTFGCDDNKIHGYPGHQLIELALVKLYKVTQNEKYIELASYFISERGKAPNYFEEEMKNHNGQTFFPELNDYDIAYSQSHKEPIHQVTAEGHAVRAMYMYSAMVDLALITGNNELKQTCHFLWDSVTKKRMYITGGIGSSGLLERFTTDYDLPNDRMYCESCASIGLMMFGQRMAALTKDASYYDDVERALYNTVIAGISQEGDRYFYVNPLEVWPDNCLEHTSLHYVKPVRQPWFDVACCPPNIGRTLASLGQYIYSVDDKSLYINLLISSEIETVVRGNSVEIKLSNDLFSRERLLLEVKSVGKNPITVRLRMPEWIENPVICLQGEKINPAIENGYVVLAINHEGTHNFEVCGEVPGKVMAANLNVRADVGKVAITKGPFIYCLEETDNGSNLAAIRIKPDTQIKDGTTISGIEGKISSLIVEGSRIVSTTSSEKALYEQAKIESVPTQLQVVPYCIWGNREPGEMRIWIDASI